MTIKTFNSSYVYICTEIFLKYCHNIVSIFWNFINIEKKFIDSILQNKYSENTEKKSHQDIKMLEIAFGLHVLCPKYSPSN